MFAESRRDDPELLPYDPNTLAALNDQILAFNAEMTAALGPDPMTWPAGRVMKYLALARGIDIALQDNLAHIHRHGWTVCPTDPEGGEPDRGGS